MRILAFSLTAALALACSKQVTAPQAQHDTGSVPPDGSDAVVPGSDAGIPPPSPPPPPPTQTPPNLGTWSQVMDWPVVAIHSHLLPDGRVLTWGHSGDPTVWDPASGAFKATPNPIDIFCGGHSLLSDGRLLVTGGNISNDHGLPDANIFDFRTDGWTQGPQMARGRWYPTNTALPNGEMVIISGEDENALPNPIPEVWQLDGTWRELTGASLGMAFYPWMFVAPDGRVFYAGWEVTTMWLDTSGTGKWTNGPVHIAEFSRVYGTAVMYAPGKVLVAGGAENPPVNTTEVIDLTQPSPAWRSSAPMIHARHHAVATSLADGTVLVTGGSSSPGTNDATGAVMTPEVWDPVTEQWTELAPMSKKRLYHSTALLLPDARVFVAGGGQPAADGETDNFNAEIFSPPYLFKPDGSPADRPQIQDAPAGIGYGQAFDVATARPGAVARVTLVKLGSMTHAFDQSQRFISLSFTAGAASVSATAPANANLAPPGHYMLFLVGPNGAPSTARIVHLG
jgi:galactose oxidase